MTELLLAANGINPPKNHTAEVGQNERAKKTPNCQGAVGCRVCYNKYQSIRLSVVKFML